MKESGTRSGSKSEIKVRAVKLVYSTCMLIFCFFLFELRATAPGTIAIEIMVSEPIDIYSRLIDAVVMVESGGNNMALNPIEEAYGAFQIRPIRLLDYNRRTGNNYKIEDCYNYKLSREIFLYYAMMSKGHDYQFIACNWNGSGKMTLDYWKKVLTHL